MTDTYSWATDPYGLYQGEFPSQEEAIAEALKEYGEIFDPITVYIGRNSRPSVYEFADCVLDGMDERMADHACDFAGEAAEDWAEINKADYEDLRDQFMSLFERWAVKVGLWPPPWYAVDEVEEFPFTAETAALWVQDNSRETE